MTKKAISTTRTILPSIKSHNDFNILWLEVYSDKIEFNP